MKLHEEEIALRRFPGFEQGLDTDLEILQGLRNKFATQAKPLVPRLCFCEHHPPR